jgi:hypothetical protein
MMSLNEPDDFSRGASRIFDTNAISDDPAYWDALAERVSAGVLRQQHRTEVEWLGQPRAWLAASVLAAVGLAGTMLLSNLLPRSHATVDWTAPLVAPDDMARTIMFRSDPPPIGAVMITTNGKPGK